MTGERTVVSPGHGAHAGRGFVEASLVQFRSIAALATRVHAGDIDLETALDAAPWPGEPSREPLERALAQLRGELGSVPPQTTGDSGPSCRAGPTPFTPALPVTPVGVKRRSSRQGVDSLIRAK